MTDARLRSLRIWLPIAEFIVISVALFPWMNATASDGPQNGQTWSWNVLGLPLVPGTPAVLIWLASAAIICTTTWVLLSSHILRQLESSVR